MLVPLHYSASAITHQVRPGKAPSKASRPALRYKLDSFYARSHPDKLPALPVRFLACRWSLRFLSMPCPQWYASSIMVAWPVAKTKPSQASRLQAYIALYPYSQQTPFAFFVLAPSRDCLRCAPFHRCFLICLLFNVVVFALRCYLRFRLFPLLFASVCRTLLLMCLAFFSCFWSSPGGLPFSLFSALEVMGRTFCMWNLHMFQFS